MIKEVGGIRMDRFDLFGLSKKVLGFLRIVDRYAPLRVHSLDLGLMKGLGDLFWLLENVSKITEHGKTQVLKAHGSDRGAKALPIESGARRKLTP